MTCRYRYESDAFGPLISLCLVYNGCFGRDLSMAVGAHIKAERARLGTRRTFDDVEGCPAHEEGKPMYVERGDSYEWFEDPTSISTPRMIR
jgi:hypothetical protein